MKFFTSIANALNKGYKFEEKATPEWRLVVGVTRQYGWVGEDKEALRVFRMLDLLNASYKVRREKMLAQFRPRQRPPGVEQVCHNKHVKTPKSLNIFFFIMVETPLFP